MTIQEKLRSRQDYVLEQYHNGVSLRKIASEFDCNSGTVYYFLNNLGVLKDSKKRKPQEVKKLLKDAKKLFESGISAYEISQRTGVNNATVNRYLKKMGCDTSRGNTQRKIPLKNHTEKIIEEYLSGVSAAEIARKYNAGSSSVWRLLESNGIETRDNTIWSVNENYFDELNHPNKLITLGLWYSDGNNAGKAIRISICDKDTIEFLANEFEYTGPIHEVVRTKNNPNAQLQYELCINRQSLSRRLTELGCPPAKTFLLKYPDFLTEEQMRSFILGYWLGDGSLSGGSWSITGTYDLIHGIMIFLRDKLGVRIGEYCKGDERIITGMVTRSKDSIKVLDYIYEGNPPVMARKYNKYIALKESLYGRTDSQTG